MHQRALIFALWGGLLFASGFTPTPAQTLNEILARHTGQEVGTVAADGERDKFFDAKEALAYGLVDEVAEFPANKGIKNTDSK